MQTKYVLTHADVVRIVAAAREEAVKNQWAVTIAVVDDGGHPLALERLDGCAPIGAYIAPQKARTAATGRLHDGFGARLDGGPPGVDVASCAVEAGVLRIQVEIHRATATGLARRHHADAKPVEHAGRSRIGVGRKAGLHATFEHQHLARMLACRPGLRR